jgi:hypothetical protein
MIKSFLSRPLKQLVRAGLSVIVAVVAMALPPVTPARALWYTTTSPDMTAATARALLPTSDDMGTSYSSNVLTPMIISVCAIPTAICQASLATLSIVNMVPQRVTTAFDYSAAAARRRTDRSTTSVDMCPPCILTGLILQSKEFQY